MMRIGIFGGSFDPVHTGHTRLGAYLLQALALDKLIVVPAAVSPFKTGTNASDEDRLDLARLSFAGDAYEISDYEIRKGGVSYTVDTVTHFRSLYPDAALYLLIGEDQLLQFHKWYLYRDIIEMATLVAVRRNTQTPPGALAAYLDAHPEIWKKCILENLEPFQVSSTEIREKAARVEDIRGLVHPAAETYIFTHGLYAEETVQTMISDIRGKLSDYRFYHSMCVADAGRVLALRYGGDPKRAFIAGILHDAMKELKKKESLAYLEQSGVSLTPLERQVKKVHHQMAGAYYAKTVYDPGDDVVLAVRYHTTGREDMTQLEKIVFVADFISADRTYPGVEEMRRRAQISLEYAMEEGLRFTIEDLAKDKKPIHPDTIACYNQILLENQDVCTQ